MKQEQDKRTILIQTRATKEEFALFSNLAKRVGLNAYTFLRNIIDCMIRYSDDRHALSPDLENIIRIFENFQGWSSLSTICGTGKKRVMKCVYLIVELDNEKTDNGQKVKNGLVPVLVDNPMEEATYNKHIILEEIIKAVSIKLYTRLKEVGKELETPTMYETIMQLCEMFREDPDAAYIREMFSDCRRDAFGKDWREQQRYIRHNNKQDNGYE